MPDATLRPAGAGGIAAGRPGHRLASRLAMLTGWRRYAAAAAFGGLATLALPPAGAVPVLLLAFPGLLWLLEGAATRRAAFFTGWWFGFGHFVLGLYWISFALLTDVAKFWWMMPFAIAGLPALLAIFIGLATPTEGGAMGALGWLVLAARLGSPKAKCSASPRRDRKSVV